MRVDLHLHSTASDGATPPEDVPAAAQAAGLAAFALTDHDTVDGVNPAQTAAEDAGVTVIAGCEISVAVWWGELHLLAYFVPTGPGPFRVFLDAQRARRAERALKIVDRLGELGVAIDIEDVRRIAGTAVIARPHIARALVESGRVDSVMEAFDRFLADRAPANVSKELPELPDVTGLVRSVGGVTSAAHLKERAGRKNIRRLAEEGVDGIEALHPSHDTGIVHAVTMHARRFGLLLTGGSDWHGHRDYRRSRLGAMDVPVDWLWKLEALHQERTA